MTEEEFYQKIPTWIGADRSSWNHITLFAYFCHKYQQKTGVRFKMVRSKAGPTSTKETRDFAKIVRGFCSDNWDDLDEEPKMEQKVFALNKTYNYINWMFDYKYRTSPAVSGTQVFLVPSVMNEFERMYSAHLKAKKSESSIESFLIWIGKAHPEALDRYQLESQEDLALFVKYVENHRSPNEECRKILEKIKEMNLL
jgi:hypothetical protein